MPGSDAKQTTNQGRHLHLWLLRDSATTAVSQPRWRRSAFIAGSRSRSTPSSRVWMIDRSCCAAISARALCTRNDSWARASTSPGSIPARDGAGGGGVSLREVTPGSYLKRYVTQTKLVRDANQF